MKLTGLTGKARITMFVLPIIFLLTVSGCAGDSYHREESQEFTAQNFIMDTLIQITVYTTDKAVGETALKEAFGEFFRMHQLTDKFAAQNLENPQMSDVYRINQSAGIKPVKVSDDTIKILEMSLAFFELSEGAFDPSIGPAIESWGFGGYENKVPGKEELDEKLGLVGLDRLIINTENKTAFLPQKGMILDLGGVAKGYATDLAVKKLKEIGIKHALINAGGNVYALGTKPDGTNWRVGIQDPREENAVWAVLSVAGKAVVSSGDYERYFIQDNVRYHHIINPETGKPAEGLMETTVVAESAAEADILSTALFVLGKEKGRELVKSLPGVTAVFLDENRNISFSQELEEALEFIEVSSYQGAGTF